MTKTKERKNMYGVVFGVNDKVRILSSCSGTAQGEIYELKLSQCSRLIATHDINSGLGCTCIDNWELLPSEWDR